MTLKERIEALAEQLGADHQVLVEEIQALEALTPMPLAVGAATPGGLPDGKIIVRYVP